jgi:hypothetical protein
VAVKGEGEGGRGTDRWAFKNNYFQESFVLSLVLLHKILVLLRPLEVFALQKYTEESFFLAPSIYN